MRGLDFLIPKVGMNLSRRKIDGLLENWSVVDDITTESVILNRRIHAYGSETEQVVGVDRRNNRILTLDNNVYELGIPDPEWAKDNAKTLATIQWDSKKKQR